MPCAVPAQPLGSPDNAQLAAGQDARLIVRSRPGLKAHKRHELFTSHGARTRREIAPIDASIIEVPRHRAAKTIAALKASGAFAFVEEDGLVQGDSVVNDPFFEEQWG